MTHQASKLGCHCFHFQMIFSFRGKGYLDQITQGENNLSFVKWGNEISPFPVQAAAVKGWLQRHIREQPTLQGLVFHSIEQEIKKKAWKRQQTHTDYFFFLGPTQASIKIEGQRWTGTFEFLAFAIQVQIFCPFRRGDRRHVEDKRQWFDSIWICFPCIHS